MTFYESSLHKPQVHDEGRAYNIWVITSRSDAQLVISKLRVRQKLHRSLKIIKNEDSTTLRSSFFLNEEFKIPNQPSAIPTLEYTKSLIASTPSKSPEISSVLGLDSLSTSEPLVLTTRLNTTAPVLTKYSQPTNPSLTAIIQQWLESLPQGVKAILPAPILTLLTLSTFNYQKYGSLLLLAPTTFKHPSWQMLLSSNSSHLPSLYTSICSKMGVTHIAINAPIPLLSSDTPEIQGETNTIRAPINFTPLSGDFGPANDVPTQDGFEHAFWVSVRQNGIEQVFAPRYVMFSRGNVKEKMRVLSFPGLSPEERGQRTVVAAGQTGPGARTGDGRRGATAVDLYAGIGYFAFSYAKAGAEKILCWEINPWSVEGLRRGAEKNGWSVNIVKEAGSVERVSKEGKRGDLKDRFLVFVENNNCAADRVEVLRAELGPIRHVNCGYLPTSDASWETAVKVLDPEEGGWIHAHENVAEKDIPQRMAEIEMIFADTINNCLSDGVVRHVKCEHIEKIKSYAPGVIHCVFDIYIEPMLDPNPSLVSLQGKT